MKNIPYGKQHITNEDLQAVENVLLSDFLTQGPTVELFEKKIAEYCNVKYAVAVSNATAALHISCLALGLAPGDVIATSPNTFVASSNCALYCGASVEFIDIELATYNISIQNLITKLESGFRPKIVIPVHFAGASCDMEKLFELKKKYGFQIIEDASHAVGATYRDQKVGSCQFSDICVFSFHPVKIITTGEGGIITTNNFDTYKKLILLRSHGITRDPNLMLEKPHGAWFYSQISLGFNYRLTDIQAALGLSQMNRLNEYVNSRNKLASTYGRKIKDRKIDITVPFVQENRISSWHLYVILLNDERNIENKNKIFEYLKSKGIGVNIHYIPVPSQHYYTQLGYKTDGIPQAMIYYKRALTLPLFPMMTEEDIDYILNQLEESLQ